MKIYSSLLALIFYELRYCPLPDRAAN
jgi:hypothetical protein